MGGKEHAEGREKHAEGGEGEADREGEGDTGEEAEEGEEADREELEGGEAEGKGGGVEKSERVKTVLNRSTKEKSSQIKKRIFGKQRVLISHQFQPHFDNIS